MLLVIPFHTFSGGRGGGEITALCLSLLGIYFSHFPFNSVIHIPVLLHSPGFLPLCHCNWQILYCIFTPAQYPLTPSILCQGFSYGRIKIIKAGTVIFLVVPLVVMRLQKDLCLPLKVFCRP